MGTTWELRVRGLVQGVGLRPCVWHLARDANLCGEVLNDASGVLIRLAGSRGEAEAFAATLRTEKPPLARIDALEITALDGDHEWRGFHIIASEGGQVSTAITPDAATCADCVAEIIDPTDRRHGYAFTNCTNCGPRLTITSAIPYDRGQTSMAPFKMCPECQREYDDPADRRFHAQPNACPACGPRLALVDGEDVEHKDDPVAGAARLLRDGRILAIKGLGGFQLAVDAGNDAAVQALRYRKHRRHKPLALMVRDMGMAARFVVLDPAERAAMESWQAPIVLARIKAKGDVIAAGVAPDQDRLGIMLPNSPLHHLLMARLDRPIVLTSGNLSQEPQVSDNAQALRKLAGIADFWLLHDRDIVNRMDDSVIQVTGGACHVLRRARGFAPAPLALHRGFADAPPVLAMGADLKNTFCLMQDGQAVVSQHMGDMETPETQRDFHANIALYQRIYDFTAARIAVDLHPGYFTTRLGQERAAIAGLPLEKVQHHHAHIAAALAEHGLGPDCDPVLGVVLDGLGHGTDDTLWGGEFLLADYRGFSRLAHFPAIALLGGDKANRQPWRNTLAHLLAAFGPAPLDGLKARFGALPVLEALSDRPVPMLEQMLEKGLNCPRASSTGRLFDAVAGALGICFDLISHEGEAAMQLQALAETRANESGSYDTDDWSGRGWKSLWQGILGDLSGGVPEAVIAKRFHNSLVRALCIKTVDLCVAHNVASVVLSGGVFANSLLLEGVRDHLRNAGLQVLTPLAFPAGDGGIALGQSVIASARAFSLDRQRPRC